MFKNILAATDKITLQDQLVSIAAQIAEKNNAKMHIIHALDVERSKKLDDSRHHSSAKKAPTRTSYEEVSAQNQMIEIYADGLWDKGDYEIKVVTGFPWPEIVSYAGEIEADLVIIGPHSIKAPEKGGVMAKAKIGTTAESVIKRVHCPVMVVNNKNTIARFSFQRILVCIDFSKSCECALAFAAKLSKTYGAKLSVFHMVPIPPHPEYSQDNYQADVEASDRKLASLCERFAEDADYDYFVSGGAHPHLEILKRADKQAADVILMGSHTKSKHGQWYPGSAVEKVSSQSRCPVIVFSDPASLRPWDEVQTRRINTKAKADLDRSLDIHTAKNSNIDVG
jgi:nucleotide-binding universal stress UspA family protein